MELNTAAVAENVNLILCLTELWMKWSKRYRENTENYDDFTPIIVGLFVL